MENKTESPPKLILSKSEYITMLTDRITLGHHLLRKDVTTVSEFNNYLQTIEAWEEYSRHLLQASFSIYNNRYYLKYK